MKAYTYFLFTIVYIFLGANVMQAEHGEIEKVVKTDNEWKQLLNSQQYNVLREEGTERAGTSPLNHEHREGVYACAACGLPLFRSTMKYESGTGWPSFFDVIPGHVEKRIDRRLVFLERTEYHCARCGGHQGHVFDDGPKPTGLRYCNNGVALKFIPQSVDNIPTPRKEG